MTSLRRFFFYVFLAIYVVATPVAILYALGYMWAPGSAQGLVRSGIVALSTTPDDAQVWLGGSRYTRRTPTLLRGLLPGEYIIRLAKTGFDDLVVTARVEADRATALDRLILLPVQRMPQPISDDRWNDVFAAAGGSSILLRRDDRFFLFDARAPERAPREISRLFTAPPDEIAWDARDAATLFIRVGTRVHRIDLAGNAIYPDIAPPTHRIASIRRRLFIADADDRPLRLSRDGKTYPAPDYVPPQLFTLARHAPLPDVDGSEWLYANSNRIAVIAREESEDEDWAWRDRTLYAHTDPIARVQWMHDDSHILFSSASTLWLLARERGGGGAPRAICRMATSGGFHFDERSGLVWLLDPDGRLVSLALMPPRALLPIVVRREGPQ